MSEMKELYLKVTKDADLQAKITEILKNAEKAGEDTTKERLIQFAKEEGFEITVEEMQAFFKDLAENNSTELSAAELDMVAGGKGTKPLISRMDLGVDCFIHSMVLQRPLDNCSIYI